MKKIFIVITFLLAFYSSLQAQNKIKIWVVRHAEKLTDDPKNSNPDLSETGFKRAEDLKNELSKENIDLIYSTTYKRTEETASPLAKIKGIEIKNYSPNKQQELVAEIKGLKGTHGVLIVGHSNTVLQLIRDFGLEMKLKDLNDDDYDYLFELTFKGEKAKLKVKHFGALHHSTEI